MPGWAASRSEAGIWGHMDLKGRRNKGRAIRGHMRTELVETPFWQTLGREGSDPGLIVQSVRGCQYAARREFRQRLNRRQDLSNTSAQGNCYDKTATEEAGPATFDWIEEIHNRQRIQERRRRSIEA